MSRRHGRIGWIALVTFICLPASANSQLDDTLRVRVVDVGAGLCTITRVPGGGVMVYDAGHWQGQRCLAAIRAMVPGDTIDLMVLSHSDSDQLGDVPETLAEYHVRQILWTGFRRPGLLTWEQANNSIAEAVRTEGTSVRAFSSQPLNSGETIRLGAAVVTLLGGWGT